MSMSSVPMSASCLAVARSAASCRIAWAFFEYVWFAYSVAAEPGVHRVGREGEGEGEVGGGEEDGEVGGGGTVIFHSRGGNPTF